MVDQITFQTLFQFLQTISIMVGITYYFLILRNNEKTRQTDMLMFRLKKTDHQWFQDWTTVLNMRYTDFQDWREKYGPQSNPDAYAAFSHIATVYNNVGLLLHEKQVEPATLFRQYTPGSIIRIWRKYEVVVKGRREQSNSELWEFFEYLADEAIKRAPDLTMPLDI